MGAGEARHSFVERKCSCLKDFEREGVEEREREREGERERKRKKER